MSRGRFVHGALDEDGRCVMSGLLPRECGGCRGSAEPLDLGPTWGDAVEDAKPAAPSRVDNPWTR